MNDLQQIFTVTYSILYGIMLNSCGGLVLFPFGLLFKAHARLKKVAIRILFSFIIIDLLPFVYFALVYGLLGSINNDINLEIIVGTFLLSLFAFGFYRVFHIVIMWKKDLMYDSACRPTKPPERVKRILKEGTLVGHFLGVLLYFFLAGLGLLLLSQVRWGLTILFCSFMVGFLSIFIRLINCDP